MPKNHAVARKREILRQFDNGTWREERPDRTVEEFLKSWLDATRYRVAATTHARYSGLVSRYFVPVIGGTLLRNVTPEHIRKIDRTLVEQGLSPQTRLHAHRALHTAFAFAVEEEGLLEQNVISKVRAPKVESRTVTSISHDKVRAVLTAVHGTRLEAPVVLASLTGLRRGELLAVRWKNVRLDGDKPALHVTQALEHTRAHGVRFKAPKSEKSRRLVPLAPESVTLLRSHKARQDEIKSRAGAAYADNDLVFPNPDGAPWPPDSFSVQFGKLTRLAGCEGFRLHDLRHGFATLMLADGVSLKEVSGLLGHSAESLTLSTYAHVIEGYGRAAVTSLAATLLGSAKVAGSP